MPITDSLAARISDHRQTTGTTREELARQLGVSVAAIGKWERGQRAPSDTHLSVLESILGGTTPTTDEAVTGGAAALVSDSATDTVTAPAPRARTASKRGSTAKKAVAKKAVAKKSAAKKAVAKKAVAKKAVVKKAVGSAAPVGRRVVRDRTRTAAATVEVPAPASTTPVVLMISAPNTAGTVETFGEVNVVQLDLTDLRRASSDAKGQIVAELTRSAAELPGPLMLRALHRITEIASR